MNPHFVFNSLNAIQECIVTGKIEEAYTYLSRFSRLLRLVLEHSDVGEISLHEELEVLSLFVSLEQLRFRNEMEFVMDVEEALDKDEIMIPPMLIQPHLENAIWHGLRNKEGKKLLKLTIREHIPDYLEVVIEDNGVGRIRAQEMRQGRLGGSTHTSKGKQLSGNRMELLKSNHAMTGMTITDLAGEDGTPCGTKVQLVIPIIGK
ncbi:MAG: histidine kinase [Saprospiraceae bacterium]|nr:histidine kinase [Candidatus Opimibacter skivensis]